MSSSFPLSKAQLDDLISKFPTPFYLYDEKAIRENMQKFTKAFSIFPVFREHFAVKACPNPYILKILADEGCGTDCSSLPELMLSEIAGVIPVIWNQSTPSKAASQSIVPGPAKAMLLFARS